MNPTTWSQLAKQRHLRGLVVVSKRGGGDNYNSCKHCYYSSGLHGRRHYYSAVTAASGCNSCSLTHNSNNIECTTSLPVGYYSLSTHKNVRFPIQQKQQRFFTKKNSILSSLIDCVAVHRKSFHVSRRTLSIHNNDLFNPLLPSSEQILDDENDDDEKDDAQYSPDTSNNHYSSGIRVDKEQWWQDLQRVTRRILSAQTLTDEYLTRVGKHSTATDRQHLDFVEDDHECEFAKWTLWNDNHRRQQRLKPAIPEIQTNTIIPWIIRVLLTNITNPHHHHIRLPAPTMEQAWTLLEHFIDLQNLQQQPHVQDEQQQRPKSQLLQHVTMETIHWIMDTYKAVWLARKPYHDDNYYWQNPQQMWNKLQNLVVVKSYPVPLFAVSMLLEAVRDDIKWQHYNKTIRDPTTGSRYQHAMAVELAQDVLTFLNQQQQLSSSSSSSSSLLVPTSDTYRLVMDIWSYSNLPQAPAKVEQLLRYLQKQQQEHEQFLVKQQDKRGAQASNSFIFPTSECYQAAIIAWVNHAELHPKSQSAAVQQALSLFQDMRERYNNNKKSNHGPKEMSQVGMAQEECSVTTTTTPPVLTTSPSPSTNHFMDDAAINMKEEEDMVIPIVKPTGMCFGIVMSALGKLGMVSEAQELFREQYQLFETTGDIDICPNVMGMNALIRIWGIVADSMNENDVTSNSKTQGIGNGSLNNTTDDTSLPQADAPLPGLMAEKIISLMEFLAHKTGDTRLLPNAHTYRQVMKVWVKSCRYEAAVQHGSSESPHHREAPLRVEAMLRRMEFYYQNGLLNESPGMFAYGMVVDAWCKAGDPERAEAWLYHLHNQWQQHGSLEMKPTRIHYNMVIAAWSKSDLAEAPQRAARLVNEMQQADDVNLHPDSATFFLLRRTTAKRADSSEEHSKIQTPQREMDGQGMGDVESFDLKENETLKREQTADRLSFYAQLNAFARAGDAERAESMLRHVKSNGDIKPGMSFEPDIKSYNTVLDAWSRSNRPDAPERAQALFDELMQQHDQAKVDCAKPDLVTYTNLMTVYNKSKRHDRVERVLALFEDRKRRYEAGDHELKPDVKHCTAMLNAWSKAGHADKAEAFLDQMITDDLVAPDTFAFATVITAWANSNDPQAGTHAERLLRRIQQMSNNQRPSEYSTRASPCQADTVCYNGTLNAWVKSLVIYQKQQKVSAASTNITPEIILHRMEELLLEMMEQTVSFGNYRVTPNLISFSTYLKALQKYSPRGDSGRSRRAQWIMDQLQQLQLVPNDDILKRMRNCMEG